VHLRFYITKYITKSDFNANRYKHYQQIDVFKC